MSDEETPPSQPEPQVDTPENEEFAVEELQKAPPSHELQERDYRLSHSAPPRAERQSSRKIPSCGGRATAGSQRSSKSLSADCCISDKMVREIRKKAEIRALRLEDPGNPDRLKKYLIHRFRVHTARPVVDSTPPTVSKVRYMPSHYNQRLGIFARIERENTILLQHLAEIIHGKGMTDNWLKVPTKATNNRGQARQLKLLRITIDNLVLLKRIQAQKPVYSRKQQLKQYGKEEEVMARRSLYPLYWRLNKQCKYGPYEAQARANACMRPRPRCFLTLGTAKSIIGRFVVELNAEECPMTSENFRGLCTGEYGFSYRCSTIHRVIKDVLWQGGDVMGNGGRSIYGDVFPDENFRLKHDKAGVVSMANYGPNTNGSQFIITAKKLPVLDGTNVVFGQVLAGLETLKKLHRKLTPLGKLKETVYIADCGELHPDADLDAFLGAEDEEQEEVNYTSEEYGVGASDSEPTNFYSEGSESNEEGQPAKSSV